jgi:hypothetical protein
MDRNARLAIFRENPCPAYFGDFFCSAHEGINIIAERCFEVVGYARFKLAGILHLARKNYIPARDERLHIIEPKLLEQIPQLTHRQTPLTQIYPTEKSNVSLHSRWIQHLTRASPAAGPGGASGGSPNHPPRRITIDIVKRNTGNDFRRCFVARVRY